MRRHLTTIATLLCCMALLSCGARETSRLDRFWLRSPGAALMQLSSPPAPGAPGERTRHDVAGLVKAHQPSGRAGVDFKLVIGLRDDKTVELAYRLGLGRRAPIESGDTVRLTIYERGHTNDAGTDRGMILRRLETEAVGQPVEPAEPGAGAKPPKAGAKAAADPEATLRTVTRTLVVIDENNVLPEEALDPSLRALRATDVVAYQEAGAFRPACQDIREHRYFRLLQPRLLTGSDAKVLGGRLFAPGSRLRLRIDATNSYDVVLLDNVAVRRSTCRMKPDASWSWSAVRVEVL